MVVRSIASHQQYLLSMHVLLITAAGCPLHGPELFIHTNRHKCAAPLTHIHKYTQNTASQKKLAFCLSPCLRTSPPLSLYVHFFPSFFFSLSLAYLSPGHERSRLSLSLALPISLSLVFLTSRSPRCLLVDACFAQHIRLRACCVF